MAKNSNWKPYAKSFFIAPVALGVVGGLVWYGVSRTKNRAPVVSHSESETLDERGSEHVERGEHEREGKSHRTRHAREDSDISGESDGRGSHSTSKGSGRKLAGGPKVQVEDLPVSAVLPVALKDYAALPLCSREESRGMGPTAGKVEAAEWSLVMETFHEAKADLLAWLEEQAGAHPRTFPAELRESMEAQVRDLRIQRPPTPEEPDLTWRGIAVMSEDSEGLPLVRLGSGMVSLLKSDPRRARFEFTRVIAQRWSPCALSSAGAEKVWNSLKTCMGVTEDYKTSCADGGFSEAGWMTSTALAARVSSPGCRIEGLAASAPNCSTTPAGTHSKGHTVSAAAEKVQAPHGEVSRHIASESPDHKEAGHSAGGHSDVHGVEHAKPAHHPAEAAHKDSHAEGGHP